MACLDIFPVDVVMCIDKTGSMHYIWDEIKSSLDGLVRSVFAASSELGKEHLRLRIKVIAFGDYSADADPMSESQFFEMPEDMDALRAFLDSTELGGGGDIAEDALEALSLALRSDFSEEGRVRRHIVMMFSDAGAHALGTNAHTAAYPDGMPEDIARLEMQWEGRDPSFSGSLHARSARLVAFVPHEEPWDELESWDRSIVVYPPSNAGEEYVGVLGSEDFCRLILT